MNLYINYLPNDTGLSLAENLKKELQKVSTRNVNIHGLDYNEIFIKDDKTNIKKVINTPKAIKNILDFEETSGIYKLNGIASDLLASETIVRMYEVLICDLKIISIRLTTYGKPKNQVKYIRETENSKVCDMAKKALHLIGLDIAMVTIVLTAKRRLKVREVNPSPLVRDKDLALIVKMLVEIYNSDEIVQSRVIKLGADPEFMLFNAKSGKMISASEFFPRDGIVGTDNIRIPNRQQRPIAEIRPKPNECPLDLIENIKQALESANRLAPYKNVKWVAGSQPMNNYSIGGHIHFSKISISGALLRALDNYLGILIFLIEEPTTAAKRRKKYGFLGDYRLKEHGGFEYRTLGSWLVSQKIATAVLCLAKLIVSRYPYLPKNFLNTLEAQRAFYSGDQEYFLKYFYSLWENIKEVDMYSIYADELKVIHEMIVSRSHWDEKSDFRKSWNINITSKRYAINKSSQVSQTTVSGVQVTRSTSRITRNTRITASSSSNRSTTRPVSTINADRRSNNTVSGRIIGSGQIRRTHRIR